MRAKKRIAYTQSLIEEIGLERERLELIVTSAGKPVTIDELARGLLAQEASIGASPVKGNQA
jgi:coenzyme F420-reducing hydrogenase delta subunit